MNVGYISNAVLMPQLDIAKKEIIMNAESFYVDAYVSAASNTILYSAIDKAVSGKHGCLELPADMVPSVSAPFTEKLLPSQRLAGSNITNCVPAVNRNSERQIEHVTAYSLDTNGIESLQMDAGDVFITSTLINFSRDLYTIVQILYLLSQMNIRVIGLYEGFDSFSDSCFQLLKSFGTLDLIHDSIKKEKGIQVRNNQIRAREEGKTLGRKSLSILDYPEFPLLYAKYMSREISKTQFAEQLDVSRPTLSKLIAEFEKGARRK